MIHTSVIRVFVFLMASIAVAQSLLNDCERAISAGNFELGLVLPFENHSYGILIVSFNDMDHGKYCMLGVRGRAHQFNIAIDVHKPSSALYRPD